MILTLLDLSGLFIADRTGSAMESQQEGMNSPSTSDKHSSEFNGGDSESSEI